MYTHKNFYKKKTKYFNNIIAYKINIFHKLFLRIKKNLFYNHMKNKLFEILTIAFLPTTNNVIVVRPLESRLYFSFIVILRLVFVNSVGKSISLNNFWKIFTKNRKKNAETGSRELSMRADYSLYDVRKVLGRSL